MKNAQNKLLTCNINRGWDRHSLAMFRLRLTLAAIFPQQVHNVFPSYLQVVKVNRRRSSWLIWSVCMFLFLLGLTVNFILYWLHFILALLFKATWLNQVILVGEMAFRGEVLKDWPLVIWILNNLYLIICSTSISDILFYLYPNFFKLNSSGRICAFCLV